MSDTKGKKPTKHEIEEAQQVLDITGIEVPKMPTPEELERLGWTPEEYKRVWLAKARDLESRKLLESVEAEKAKKNQGFIQLQRDRLSDVRKLMKKNAVAADVFLFLTEHMDADNAVVCSSKVLEEAFDKSRTTIWRATKVLAESGFVQIFNLGGNVNCFALNADVVWSSWANKKKYAQFSGQILIAESEQEKINNSKKIKAKKVKTIQIEDDADKTLDLFGNVENEQPVAELQQETPSFTTTPMQSTPKRKSRQKN